MRLRNTGISTLYEDVNLFLLYKGRILSWNRSLNRCLDKRKPQSGQNITAQRYGHKIASLLHTKSEIQATKSVNYLLFLDVLSLSCRSYPLFLCWLLLLPSPLCFRAGSSIRKKGQEIMMFIFCVPLIFLIPNLLNRTKTVITQNFCIQVKAC